MSSMITRKARELNLPTMDAEEDVEITVTNHDILYGIPTHNECALARAAKRRFQGVEGIYFFKSTAWLQLPNCFLRFVLPTGHYREISKFDEDWGRGRKPLMRAGDYTLKAPKGSTTTQAINRRSKKRPGRHQPATVPTNIKRSPRFQSIRLMEPPPEVNTRAKLKTWARKVSTIQPGIISPINSKKKP